MKISYKYLFFIILIISLLAPVQNTFAKVTCGNGSSPSCASCGSSLYTKKLVSGGCDLVGNGSKMEPCWELIYAGTCANVACGGSCTNRYAQMIPSANTIKNFYENYYTGILPKWSDSAVSLKVGSKGLPVSSLSIILEGFGFGVPVAASDTGAVIISDSYESEIIQAVIGLQKALKLPVNGNFDPTTREAFATFYYDISSILIAPATDTTKLAVVYPGGVTSFFNGAKFDKPSSIVNSFTVTTPTFIMQDSKGKNFIWQNDKWNATTTAFPTPKIPTSTGVPIKGNLSTFSTSLSTITNQISTNFTTARTVSPGTTSTTVVPSILNFLYNSGFSTYKPVSTASTFGDVSTNATKAFQGALGISPTGTFDNTTASAAKNLTDQINTAINSPSLPPGISDFFVAYPANSSASKFDPATGTFSTPLPVVDADPYSRLTEISPNPPSDPTAKPWHIICCAFGKCRFKCGLGDGYWF